MDRSGQTYFNVMGDAPEEDLERYKREVEAKQSQIKEIPGAAGAVDLDELRKSVKELREQQERDEKIAPFRKGESQERRRILGEQLSAAGPDAVAQLAAALNATDEAKPEDATPGFLARQRATKPKPASADARRAERQRVKVARKTNRG